MTLGFDPYTRMSGRRKENFFVYRPFSTFSMPNSRDGVGETEVTEPWKFSLENVRTFSIHLAMYLYLATIERIERKR